MSRLAQVLNISLTLFTCIRFSYRPCANSVSFVVLNSAMISNDKQYNKCIDKADRQPDSTVSIKLTNLGYLIQLSESLLSCPERLFYSVLKKLIKMAQ